MTEISIREKEKWTNKGTDKGEMADSSLHNANYQTQCLSQISNFIILCQAVPEKSLTEKSLHTHTYIHTNIFTEKTKTIYPLYTSYMPGV